LPYLTPAGPVSVVLFALARRGLLAAAAGTVAAATIATHIPLFAADKTAHTGIRLRVMSANLRRGTADAESVLSLACDWADILAVQELTPDELWRLSASGVDKVFPYRLIDQRRPRSYELGLWSRYPLAQLPEIGGTELPFLGATIQVLGARAEPLIVAAHLANPWHIGWWSRDIQKLAKMLRAVDERATGAVIIAGDMNSTLDMRPFRNLLRRGYRDAAEQAGAGFCRTFPAGMPIPPLFAIDHVLTLRCTAVAVYTVTLPGSDHRAVAASVNIPA
jgi:endonuclease/exonuclease/phosphatase (EEP) superfamily protein YafD